MGAAEERASPYSLLRDTLEHPPWVPELLQQQESKLCPVIPTQFFYLGVMEINIGTAGEHLERTSAAVRRNLFRETTSGITDSKVQETQRAAATVFSSPQTTHPPPPFFSDASSPPFSPHIYTSVFLREHQDNPP
ncbi:hypothetical protein CRENBAI_011671 [Crenichthys baileyi]|uniref:Uncharacterized protein n=1 Tax=Crenichthys baileyi TaxID=28760 RepID=A0AAV9SBQ9_9TELE